MGAVHCINSGHVALVTIAHMSVKISCRFTQPFDVASTVNPVIARCVGRVGHSADLLLVPDRLDLAPRLFGEITDGEIVGQHVIFLLNL